MSTAPILLKDQRKRIDEIDIEVMTLMGERFGIVRQVGGIKTRNHLVIEQTARVHEVLDHVESLAGKHDLDPVLFRHIYTLLIDYAHDIENEIKNNTQQK